MAFTCPQCRSTEMATIRWTIYEYERCPNCEGAFFDFEEMVGEAVLEPESSEIPEKIYRGDDTPDRKETETRICPKCDGIPMGEREYSYDSGIHVDLCPKCHGIFLNRDELEEIRQYLISHERSKESVAMREKIPEAIAHAEVEMRKRITDLADRDKEEYAEAVKNDWIPDFLQVGLRNRLLDAFDMSVEDQLGAEDQTMA